MNLCDFLDIYTVLYSDSKLLFSEPTVCSDFAEKITAEFKVDKDGNAELNIEVKKQDEEIQPAAYIAYFDSKGRITGVEILTPDKNGDYFFEIKNGNYKIMLWDNINPIINAIHQ